ncbi:MAG: NAD(P)-dependent alcohol dehydrogenase [Saprospiraceae bacterium]|nr:NAD(P)-dependent alcohol dehydrogenase [Saprospiraceae bacterium]
MNASKKMKAVVCTRYGSPDYLKILEVDLPQPGNRDILVRVQASTVTTADTMMRRAQPFISRFFLGFFKPKKPVTGTGFAGIVEAVGSAVSRFKIGDRVFGETGVHFGANAEYLSLPEDAVVAPLPEQLNFAEAAPLTDGALTSMNFLKNLGQIKAGQQVLVVGASGSLGAAAVQIAKHFGAKVTGVSSGKNIAFVQSLGADRVIDYTVTDYTATGDRYDIVFDTAGKSSFGRSKRILKAGGRYLSPVLGFRLLFDMLRTSKSKGKKALFSATGLLPHRELLDLLDGLRAIVQTGQYQPAVERRYTLEQAAEAHRYADTGHKRGNLVLLTQKPD